MNSRDHAHAALEVLAKPKKLVSAPGSTHLEIYSSEPFEISSNAAAAWPRSRYDDQVVSIQLAACLTPRNRRLNNPSHPARDNQSFTKQFPSPLQERA